MISLANHQTVIITIFWCRFGLGKCFGASSWSSHWQNAVGCHIESTFHHMSQYDQEMGPFCCVRQVQSIFRNGDFFGFRSTRAAPIYRAFFTFHFGANVEQLSNAERLVLLFHFNNEPQTSATLLTFKALVSVGKFSRPMLRCTFVVGSLAKCLVNISTALRPSLNSFNKITRILVIFIWTIYSFRISAVARTDMDTIRKNNVDLTEALAGFIVNKREYYFDTRCPEKLVSFSSLKLKSIVVFIGWEFAGRSLLVPEKEQNIIIYMNLYILVWGGICIFLVIC
uniref:Uncharacterized protein n=1 Tax=Heterorhabditis bacteriophora TaxID=37862 RepID=A0A1I7WAM4_HETBA